MGKRKARLSIDLIPETMDVRVNVLDANDVTVATDVFSFNDVHESQQDRVSLYGLSKLLADRTSGTGDKRKKLKEMQEVMDRLAEGEWSKERVVGAPIVSVFVEALAELKGITVPQAQKALSGYAKETREKILSNQKVVEIAERIRKERDEASAPSLDDLA